VTDPEISLSQKQTRKTADKNFAFLKRVALRTGFGFYADTAWLQGISEMK
jgi:hypothetical protein